MKGARAFASWIGTSLNRKFLLGTAAGLLISSLIFLLLYIPLYHNELAEERARTAEQVNRLLQTSLENAMLKRDLPGLRGMISKLGAQKGIVSVFITNPEGEVRFASDPGRVGEELPTPFHGDRPVTELLESGHGEVLRSINPVHNHFPCTQCHGPVESRPVNGVLYVDYDAAPLLGKVRRTTLMLMGAGALIVLINLGGGWWFIRRFIARPVEQLVGAANALTDGDLSHRVEIDGRDELAQLGQAFNLMADRLRGKIQALEEQQRFRQALIDAIPDGICIIDEHFELVATNRAYREQLALDDATGVGLRCHQMAHDLEHPCPPTLLTCPVHELRDSDEPLKVLHHHQRANGETLDVEIYAAPMRASLNGKERRFVVESIRDLRREVKYSQEQRLSELGKLATGVAHEIHNPLASIRLALDGVKQQMDSADACPRSVADYLVLVDGEIDKCIKVTERLLRLGMLPESEKSLVDIRQVLSDTLSLLRWEAEEKRIRIEEGYAEPPPRVLGLDSELRMAALNLAQNAFHAMPDGGTLRVEALRDGTDVVIHFRDTGVGIAAEDLEHIFDPFFSKRADQSHGAGLGLSITHTIIENHAGTIQVTSTPGQGACFSIRLPEAGSQTRESPT